MALYEGKDSRRGPKHRWIPAMPGKSGHGLLIEDMGEAGLRYPGQDGGFIEGHKEICDQDFWVLLVCPKLEHCPLSPGTPVASWTGLTSQDKLGVCRTLGSTHS